MYGNIKDFNIAGIESIYNIPPDVINPITTYELNASGFSPNETDVVRSIRNLEKHISVWWDEPYDFGFAITNYEVQIYSRKEGGYVSPDDIECAIMERTCTFAMESLRNKYGLRREDDDYVYLRARGGNRFRYNPYFSADTSLWTTNKSSSGLQPVTNTPIYLTPPTITDHQGYYYNISWQDA